MMKKLLVFSSIFLFSCVTPSIHNDLVKQNEYNKNRANEKDLKNLKLQNEIIELKNSVRLAQENLKKIKEDSINNGQAYKSLNSKYQDLSEAYDLLSSKSSRFMSEKAKETKRLIEKLDDSQMKLISKKEELKSLSDSIQFQKDMLTKANQELDYRSLRVKELESIINKKDSMVTALKARISSALSGLEGNGLTIEKRNGKVYLSLEESLLFASGKYDVNNEGISALNKLSEVLSNQQELEIIVEGHTDSIPLSGRGLVKDNWDLSVLRATSVVKVLTNNSQIKSSQLMAAGKGEFSPIMTNLTVEGRSANRRIDIILSPNLDEFFNLLDE